MAINKTFKRFNGSIWEEYHFYAYDSAKLGGNAASYYQPASTAITTSNISSKSVASAAALTTPRTISLTGGVTGSTSFDGSSDVSITATVPYASSGSRGAIRAYVSGATGYIYTTD